MDLILKILQNINSNKSFKILVVLSLIVIILLISYKMTGQVNPFVYFNF